MFSCDWTDGLSYKLCSKSVSKLGVQCGDGDGDDGGGDGDDGGDDDAIIKIFFLTFSPDHGM